MKKKKFKIKFTRDELDLHVAKAIQRYLHRVHIRQSDLKDLFVALGKTDDKDIAFFLPRVRNINEVLIDT